MSEPLSEEKLAELQRIVDATPKAEWVAISDFPAMAIGVKDSHYRIVQTPNQNNRRHYGPSQPWLGIESETCARFIAAFNPVAVDALLSTIRTQAAELARLRAVLRGEDAEAMQLSLWFRLSDAMPPRDGTLFEIRLDGENERQLATIDPAPRWSRPDGVLQFIWPIRFAADQFGPAEIADMAGWWRPLPDDGPPEAMPERRGR